MAAAAPNPPPKHLYKLLTAAPPLPIPRTLTDVDAQDGFIHLSTAAQVPATAGRFFAAEPKLWIVKISREALENREAPAELRWEASRSHGVFAHLYNGDVLEADVISVEEFEKGDQSWEKVLADLED